MRIFKWVLTPFLFLLSINSNAQLLEGVWEGEFITEHDEKIRSKSTLYSPVTRISFSFEIEKSSYKVFSYTHLNYIYKDTIVISRVLYRKISDNEIYLEELDDVDSTATYSPCLFQKFNLTLQVKKKFTYLKGRWVIDYPGCESWGTVRLRRRNK